MAVGRPVVSTSLGAEGIPASDGENIILADKPDDFARGISDLMWNETLYEKVQLNARRLMEDKYAWEKGVALLENVLNKMRHESPSNRIEREEI